MARNETGRNETNHQPVIVRLDEMFRSEVNRLIEENWSGPVIVTRGVLHDTSDSEGFVAVEDGAIAGFVLYEIRESRCEVLVLESFEENCGVGTSLLEAVRTVAKENACTSVWLITTNDNTHAIRYYQRRGFELVAVHIDAIVESRRLKPSIPFVGFDDIPIRHEFEFAARL